MRQQIGMTFLELILVLAILGILASIAVPNFSGAFDTVDEKEIVDKLMADLRRARSMAQACAGVTVVVKIRSHGWDIEPDNCNFDDIKRDGLDSKLVTEDAEYASFKFRYPGGDTDIPEGTSIDIDIGSSITVTVTSSGEIKR